MLRREQAALLRLGREFARDHAPEVAWVAAGGGGTANLGRVLFFAAGEGPADGGTATPGPVLLLGQADGPCCPAREAIGFIRR
jgi:hypothetical protein